MKKKVISITALILILILLIPSFSSCRKEEITQSELKKGCYVPDVNSKDFELILVCPSVDNVFWQQCINGIGRADMEIGTHTTIMAAKEGAKNPEKMVECLSKAIEQKPDGIITYAGIDEMTPYIKKATKEGIPVIAIDADTKTSKRLAYVGTDLYNLGYNAGKKMHEFVGSDAKIGYICSSYNVSNEKLIMDAFFDVANEFTMDIVASREGKNDSNYAKKVAGELLYAHPEIQAIFCTGGENVTGVAQYIAENDLDIKLIGMQDTEENLKLLREGVIDALYAQAPEEMGYISVYAMKEYLDKGSLSGSSYSTDSVLITKDNVDTYRSSIFSPNTKLTNVRVGYYNEDSAFQAGTSHTRKSGYGYEFLQSIATITGWRCSYEYGTKKELLKKLRRGEIDIMAGIYKTENESDMILLSSSDMSLPEPKRYFGVSRKRKDLYDEMEGAIRKLKTEKPTYLANLYSKYYELTEANVALTKAERTYLANMKDIRFGYLRGNLPLCDQASNGDPIGLAKDIMKQTVSCTGISVRPIAYDTMNELEQALNEKEIDVAFPAYSDVWLDENNHTKQTDPIVSDRVMIVYSGVYSDNMFERVAVAETNIGQVHYMEIHHPQSQIIYKENKAAVFDSILRGKEKCTIGCSGVFQRYLFDHPEYNDLHIAYLDDSFELGLSVHEENSYLISILNKTIANMGSAKINSALLSNTGVETSTTLSDFIRDNSVLFVLVLAFVLAVIILTLFVFIRQTRKHRLIQDMTNAELEEALEIAKEASEAKTRFLSSMSHDIRTPLNAILGMTTIASEDPEAQEHCSYYLNKIAISGQHLLTLVNDILDIAKIENGKLTLTPARFSLTKSMAELETIVESTALEKDITFTAHYDDIEHDTVYADKVRVEQVFINLLSNAVKYTHTGGKVTAWLTGKHDKEAGIVHTTFIVEDTGIGMSEEFMQVMYESFARVEDSRISEIQGTGLGLSIVKQIVEMMNGTITCESKEGVGTKFTVNIDFKAIKKKKEHEHSEKDEMLFEGLHILVAEDNDLNWVVISKYLERCKFTFERACDGLKCLDKLSASKPGTYDLVLMDVQMPNMNGKDATREIRVSDRADIREIPVIAMTADAFAEDIASCLEAGMDGHVSKPIDINKMKQEINRVLSEKENKKNEPNNIEEIPAEKKAKASESNTIFSYKELSALFGNDETVLKLLHSFLSVHEDDCKKIKRHIASNEYYEARQILHSLIGVSGNFFLKDLCEASKQLGAQLRAEDVKSLDEFIEVWEVTVSEVSKVCKQLEEKTAAH